MRINTNINAMMAHRNMTSVNDGLSKSLERLSSGLRITNAKDDAAGIAVSENINTQVRALNIAERNIQDATSFLNARDSALEQLTSIAQRMRELAVSANNSFNSATTLGSLATEFATLGTEATRILTNSELNGINLFTTNPLNVQVGATSGAGDTIAFTLTAPSFATLAGTDITTAASTAITEADNLLFTAGTPPTGLLPERATNGASINRLDIALANLQVYRENLMASYSRIRDTDVAAEMTNMTRQQIILQTSTAMLAQANAQPQSVLALFK